MLSGGLGVVEADVVLPDAFVFPAWKEKRSEQDFFVGY